MQFLEFQVLNGRNLLCCEAKFDPENLAKSMNEINELLTGQGARSRGTTYLIFNSLKNQDMKVYVALDKEVKAVPPPFWIKEAVHMENAVKTRHEGDLFALNGSFHRVKQYLEERGLTPITPFCCKVMSGLKSPNDTKNTIMDIYIGVNANIL